MTNPKRCRGSISGISLQAAHAALALVVLVVAIVATQPAEAQTFTVLHTFTGYTGYPTDRARPEAVLVQDAAGIQKSHPPRSCHRYCLLTHVMRLSISSHANSNHRTATAQLIYCQPYPSCIK